MRPAAVCCAVLIGTLVLPVVEASPLGAPAGKTAADSKPKRVVEAPLTAQERALHALNRLSFGPRPEDVQRVEAMGVDRWIELQLHPEKIDDGGLQTMLKDLPATELLNHATHSTDLDRCYSRII